MNLSQLWQRATKKKGSDAWNRRALPALESLEDRCVLSTVGYSQVNLASDVPGLAHVTAPSLVNPWGITFSQTGPFWFADAGSGVSNILDGRGDIVPLAVTIPGAGGTVGQPAGTVVNAGSGFDISAHGRTAPSTFLFASTDGTIAGWTEAVDIHQAFVAVDNSALGAVYTGLTFATDASGHRFLYAADVSLGRIDVLDEHFNPVVRPGAFQDPSLPAGYSPFNVQNIGGNLYVEYVGAVGGFVDVYTADGTLVNRVASQGALNAPWGVALAPANFGKFGGALLIGNDGDGRINAFSTSTGAFLGQLADDNGNLIAIPGLWALIFGNGYAGGNADTLFFTAGIDTGSHGLFGAIQPPRLHGADTGGDKPFNPDAFGEPKDYPLPPVQDPALQDSNPGARPVSVLLPLSESSLALVPTLTVIPQSGTPAPTPTNPLIVAASEGPGATVTRYIAYETAAASSIPSDPVTISSFLDLNAAPSVPVELAIRPRVLREVDTTTRSPSVGNDASLFAEVYIGDERSDRTEEPTAPIASGVTLSPGTPTIADAPVATTAGNMWTRLFGTLLGVLAINAAAGYLSGRGRHKTDQPISTPDLHLDRTRSDG